MSRQHKVAVIGLGDVASKRHLPVLTNHPQLKITAAAEPDAGRAWASAHEFSIPLVSAEPLAIIQSPDTEIVALLTPPFTHALLARAALDAGKHVFVEKPLTVDVGEAKELTTLAGRAHAKLLVGFNLRHHPVIQTAYKMIRAGQLGTLRTVSTFLGNTRVRNTGDAWRRDPAHGGDVFFEFGVHHFDVLRYLVGSEVTELYASETTSPRGGVTATAQLHFADGTIANATVAEDTVEHNSIELVGDRGKLNLSLYRFDGLQFVPRGVMAGAVGLRASDAGKTLVALPAALPRIRRGGDYLLTYRTEWDHFCAVIETGAEPLAHARDGLEATRIAHAARQSVIQHVAIQLA